MAGRSFIISRDDWSLHRQGHIDQERHREKVKEAIRRNLADLVAEESIILSDGKKIVKVPIRSLEEYRFRFNRNQQRHAGQGTGNTQVGDQLGAARPDAAGPGKGQGTGEEPGVDYYEAEITVDELAEMIFADLGLPNLQRKRKPEISSTSYEFNDVRRHGIMSNVDKKRTILEAMKRAALAGGLSPGAPLRLGPISRDDLRFKTWEERPKYEFSAVVLAMMDTSGSMGTFEKYIARSFFFWMVRFLRTRYNHVQVVFLAHDTKAREVSEEEFFRKGESGGTKCSSVYELALELIEKRYPPDDFNVYPFHFSDGDNFPSDNVRCLKLVTDLLARSSAMGYGEIASGNYRQDSTLRSVYEKLDDPKFTCVTISDKADVYPALQAFFRREAG